MGRKLKTWTLLVIILALIYVQQAPDIYAESADKDQKKRWRHRKNRRHPKSRRRRKNR